MNPKLERALRQVQKPARYIGSELGSIQKPLDTPFRIALCFPDLYEVGMSHLGLKILYGLYNNEEKYAAERAYMPERDMVEEMQRLELPLFSLESGTPLAEFDMLGFTLQYEMSYTTILAMLELSGLPLQAAERTDGHPLVIAGGPCACNPEPLCDFVDLFVLGEGEEVSLEIAALYLSCNKDRSVFLRRAVEIQGVYVPSLYTDSYNQDGTLAALTPAPGVPAQVEKRIIKELDSAYFPRQFVVPFISTVHDRAMLEVLRGCIRGCRFCQAGFLYRPFRERSAEVLNGQARELCASTGFEEISLTSLSTSDLSCIGELLEELLDWTGEKRINLSLPSLRLDAFSPELLEKIDAVRKSGLTFAPEAGTQRLRDVINKNLTEEEILASCRTAFEGGYTAVKLYFMLGLPTETDEDILGIAGLAQRIVDLYYSLPTKPKGKGVNVTVSTSNFVPKPFTPFQYEPQDTEGELLRKQTLLRDAIRSRKISFKWHGNALSSIEAVLARGDRRLGAVLKAVYQDGGVLESWEENFSLQRWQKALAAEGLTPEFYACRRREYTELLPWEHLSYGIDREFLIREHKTALSGVVTKNCREQCAACGANRLIGGRCF